MLPSSYALTEDSIQKIADMIQQIDTLRGNLADLQSKLEKIQETNGTSNDCKCEDMEEKIEYLKSKLDEMESAYNATKAVCNCELQANTNNPTSSAGTLGQEPGSASTNPVLYLQTFIVIIVMASLILLRIHKNTSEPVSSGPVPMTRT